MPTYVYKFVDTGETIEVQQAFTDPTLTELTHPTDGVVRPVKKVFLPVGITFKGSGFYKTDSRNGKSGGASKSASSGSSSESSGSSSETSSGSSSPAPAASGTGTSSGSSSSGGGTSSAA